MKTTIAIIGSTGNMGTAIAKSLANKNTRLLLFSSNEQKRETLKSTLHNSHPDAEVETVGCPSDASWEADIIILAVPYEAEAELVPKIKQYVTRKIVISISNPINTSYDGMVTKPGTSAAEELQKLLPDAYVVKAFNTTFAADFATPAIAGKVVDAFIAGDDDTSVATVSALVASVGFHPIVAGGLAVSNTLEHMQLLLIQLSIKNNYNWQAGWKILHN